MGKNNTAKLSLDELAEEIGRNPRVVARLMERGELPVKAKGGKFAVSRDDLSAIRERLESDREEMLDKFKNKDVVRNRALVQLSSEMDYDYTPNTDRIFL